VNLGQLEFLLLFTSWEAQPELKLSLV